MSSTLLHAPEADLAAFALATRPDAKVHAEVRRHLDDGCESCSDVVGRYSKATTPDREGAIDLWIRPRRDRRCSGQRAGALADVSLVCTAGPFELDLLVREFSSPERLEFVGQITRSDQLHDPVADLALTLMHASTPKPIAVVTTDRFGEFGFGADRQAPYGLRLGGDDASPCVLVWEDF